MANKFWDKDILQSNRLPWIDYARGIAILLVLYRHIYEGITRAGIGNGQYAYLEDANIIFYSFRMPLFFILSGAFVRKSLQKRSTGELIKNKFNILLYPYLVWCVIQITLQIILSKYVNANRSLVDYGYIFLYPRRLDQFWYLYALFNVSVLYILTSQKLKLRVWQQLVIGFAMYMLSSYVSIHNIDLGFVHDILRFYGFFALGDLIGGKLLDKSMYKYYSSWWTFLALLPVFAVSQYYFLHKNIQMGGTMFVEEYQPLLFLVISLAGCAFMANIAFLLQRYAVVRILRIVGFHSLYIYVSHVLVASACRIVLVKVLGIQSVPLLLVICLIFAAVIPILLYRTAMYFGAWWLYSLERPRKQKQSSTPNAITPVADLN
ncbi:Fucose 4-O-acetylase [Chitinophaga costaii]|uniref:Fucose 4-O-acetylase n=1 Tax=Chitinophaga costaii TaxID=1335309 RepID=A0A1C4FIA6_9BACT|nr:acyltransferase [Chitinophaga costaii]PUZ20304.1 acyltransferase [Chitinophaga costaii]SCC55670.1 Fucose 4-O-acetylase [Chitinophaga costaii]